MDEEKRHAGPYWVGVFGGSLLVALLLSIASPMPVSFTLNRCHMGMPPAVPRFYQPFLWAEEHTPLRKPLNRYAEFAGRLGR